MKTKLFLILLLVSSFAFAQVPTTDLVREYLFTNGSLADGISPGTNDLVATGTSRVLINDAINQPNNALDINTDTFVGSPRGSGQNLSVSFWIKTGTVDATVRSVIEQSGITNFGPYGWKVQLVDGKIRLRSKFTNGGTDFKEVVIETSVIADNTWHHIAFTAENKQQPGYIAFGFLNRLYVDGIQEATGVDYNNGYITVLNNPNTTNTAYTHYITVSNSTDTFTDGIDNIRIYNRVLSVTEVNELYKEHFGNLNRFYVNKAASGSGYGDSWANAFTDLNKALTLASGQEIWVAQGIYTPAISDRGKTFTVSEDVKLYGGFIGNETNLQSRDFINNITTLSGDLLGNDTTTLSLNEPSRLDNSYHVITITGDATLVDGFTITSGHFDTNRYARGAGVFKDNSVNTLELRNNVIINNVAHLDGAISALFPDVGSGQIAVIDKCTIRNNLSRGRTAFNLGLAYSTAAPSSFNAYVTDCLIENNFATDINGYKGVSSSSGAFSGLSLANKVVNAYLVNSTITNNSDTGTDPALTNPALIFGGGNVNFKLYNTIVWNNSITKTFARNNNSTGFSACQNAIAFKNNITADDLSTICSGAVLANNTNVDPLFVNASTNFNLQLGSPAIDSGDNTYITSTKDIFQNDRIYNGTVDKGAYESSFGPNNKSLTLNIEGQGTLNQSSGTYAPNATVSITATSNLGATFVGWSGDVTSTNATISVLMDSNKVLTATFESPIYVNSSATGNNDGANWANAYTDLQDALQNAVTGGQIWIAKGVYKPSTSARNTYYVIDKEDLKIYGGFAGTEGQLSERVLGTNETILSGDVQGNDANVTDFYSNYDNITRKTDNTYRIINVSTAGNNLLLDGLTISDAHNNSGSTSRGAAIYKEKSVSNLTLRNCIIKDNVGRNDNAALLAEFELNNTTGDRGSLIVENCQFINNMSRWATGIYVFVRASTNVDVSVANTLFNGNLTGDLTSTVKGTSGSASWYKVVGDNSDMNLNLFNNTYVNNIDIGTDQGMTANNRGVVGISKTAGSNRVMNATVANTIFWDNKTTGNVATRSITDFYELPITSVNVYNSIDEASFNDSSLSSTTNTSDANPLFNDATNGDFTLTAASPAVNTGDNSYVTGTLDLAGNQRIFNSTVDMGAYEYVSTLSTDNFGLVENDIKLYPNPTSSVLNIKMNTGLKQATIYSILGAKVLQTQSSVINTSNLKTGMYLIEIQDENGSVSTKKFIKK
ncbi:choice-of-anchor Q domain-containing protein [Lacinutrix undariae]